MSLQWAAVAHDQANSGHFHLEIAAQERTVEIHPNSYIEYVIPPPAPASPVRYVVSIIYIQNVA